MAVSLYGMRDLRMLTIMLAARSPFVSIYFSDSSLEKCLGNSQRSSPGKLANASCSISLLKNSIIASSMMLKDDARLP